MNSPFPIAVKNGCAEIVMTDWHQFMHYVTTDLATYDSLIWRGQRSPDWKLEPTIARMHKGLNSHQRFIKREKQLENFRYAARGRRGSNPPLLQTENEWWALGQHFGLATPLLDWTHSPFVAAYFSFYDDQAWEDKQRVVFALHQPSVEEKVAEILRDATREWKDRTQVPFGLGSLLAGQSKPLPEIEFFKPFSDENQRLVNQNGLFSRSNVDIDIESWVTKNFNNVSSEMVLIKILLPSCSKNDALRILNRMNINHLSLFPDLDGAAKFCNLLNNIDAY